jgi:hypothetical protein
MSTSHHRTSSIDPIPMTADPRDTSASQDRAARLAVLGSRSQDVLARLTAAGDMPAAATPDGRADGTTAGATTADDGRVVIGRYRGQPVYADPAPQPTSSAPAEPVAASPARRLIGKYRGRPVYVDD